MAHCIVLNRTKEKLAGGRSALYHPAERYVVLLDVLLSCSISLICGNETFLYGLSSEFVPGPKVLRDFVLYAWLSARDWSPIDIIEWAEIPVSQIIIRAMISFSSVAHLMQNEIVSSLLLFFYSRIGSSSCYCCKTYKKKTSNGIRWQINWI